MDDNGPGTAGVIEIARILAPRTLERDIRFLLFGNEEVGLVGSSTYVAQLQDTELPAFFVNLDMIAVTSAERDTLSAMFGQAQGDWIGAFAPDWAAEAVAAFDAAARAFAPECKFVALSLPDDYEDEPFIMRISASDHRELWSRIAPGILLAEPFFFGAARNQNYHSSADTRETLDHAFMAEVVRAALAVVCVEAGHQS